MGVLHQMHRTHDGVRDMMLALGMNSTEASMAVPMAWFNLGTIDPYSPVVITIVRAMQRGLEKLGYPVRTDGFIGVATGRALENVSGTEWRGKSIVQVLGDIITAIKQGRRARPRETTMGYTQALGALPVYAIEIKKSQYCTVANPQGSCKPLPGISKPMDVPTAERFKGLQNEINRAAQVHGFSKVSVDGRIGPGTASALKKAHQAVFGRPVMSVYTADSISPLADNMRVGLKTEMDKVGAPAKVASPRPTIPAVDTSSGAVVDPSNDPKYAALAPFTGLGGPQKVMMLGLLGVVGFALWKTRDKKKPKRKAAKPRRRRRLPKVRVTTTRY